MKNLYPTLLLLFSVLGSQAQFNGYYDPSNWTIKNSPGSNASANFDNAPDEIMLQGSDGPGGSAKDIDMTIRLQGPGRVQFSWNYHTDNSDGNPAFDIAGFVINGVFTQLSSNSGGIDQAGDFVSPVLPAGTSISIRVRSIDNARGPAFFTVFNFAVKEVILPVKLTAFSGYQEDGIVYLQWKTGGEENFSHFELEKADENMNYHKIETFAGGQEGYETKDAHPQPGSNLYRLRMVDINGSFSFSPIVTIKTPDVIASLLFPNPVYNQVSLDLKSVKPVKETVHILNEAGQIIQTNSFDLKKGTNQLQITTQQLKAGRYILRMATSGQTKVFVKI